MSAPPALLLPGAGAFDMDNSGTAFSPLAAGVTPASRRAASLGPSPTDGAPAANAAQPTGVHGPSAEAMAVAFPPKSLALDPRAPDAAHSAMGDVAVGVTVAEPLRHYVVNESEPVGPDAPALSREVRIALQLPKVAAANRVQADARIAAPLARWSAVEDRLILGAEGKGQNPVAEYANARQRAPELFPKPVVHPDLLPKEGAAAESGSAPSRLGKAVNRRGPAVAMVEDSPAAAAGAEVRAAALAWHAAIEGRLRELQAPAHRPRNKMLLQLSLDDLETLWRRCSDSAGVSPLSPAESPLAGGASPDRASESGGAALHSAVSLNATSSIFTTANDLILRGVTRHQARRADEDRALEGKPPRDPHDEYPRGVGDEVECSSVLVCSQARYIKARFQAAKEAMEFEAQRQHGPDAAGDSDGDGEVKPPPALRRIPGSRAHRMATSTRQAGGGGGPRPGGASSSTQRGTGPAGPVAVCLCEAEPMYQNFPEMHDVFALDNLRRFVAFCEAPNLLEEREEKAQQVAAAEARARRVYERLRLDADAERRAHTERIAIARSTAEAALNARIDAWFERDVAALRKAYDAHRHVEKAKLSQAFDEATKAADRFFAAEAQVSAALLGELTGGGGADFAASMASGAASSGVFSSDAASGHGAAGAIGHQRSALAALDRRMADVLPKYGVPRLLLLAELVVAPNLKDTCTRIIANDLPHFVNDTCLASSVIPEATLRAITSQCPLNTLVAARNLLRETAKRAAQAATKGEANGADVSGSRSAGVQAAVTTGFPPDFIEEEYTRRRHDALAAYRKLPLATLQRLCDPVERAAYLAGFAEDDADDDYAEMHPAAHAAAVVKKRPPLFTDADTLDVCNDLLWQARGDAEHVSERTDANAGDDGGGAADDDDSDGDPLDAAAHAAAAFPTAKKGAQLVTCTGGGDVQAEKRTPSVAVVMGCAVAPPPGPIISGSPAARQRSTAAGGSAAAMLGIEVVKAPTTAFAGAAPSVTRRRVILRQPDVEYAIMPAVAHQRRHELAARRCGGCTLRYHFACHIDAVDRACDFAVHVQLGLLVPKPPSVAAAGSDPAPLAAADGGLFAVDDIASAGSLLWTRDGVLLVDGVPVPFPVPAAAAFAAGDDVAIAVNEATGDVAFFRNGVSVEPPSGNGLLPEDEFVSAGKSGGTAASGFNRANKAASASATPQHANLLTPGDAAMSVSTTVPMVSATPRGSPTVADRYGVRWLRGVLQGRGPVVPVLLVSTAAAAPLSAAAKRALAATTAVHALGDAVSATVDFGGPSAKPLRGLPATFIPFDEAVARV